VGVIVGSAVGGELGVTVGVITDCEIIVGDGFNDELSELHPVKRKAKSSVIVKIKQFDFFKLFIENSYLDLVFCIIVK